MPRQSIEDLAPPKRAFRIDQMTDGPSGVTQPENEQVCIREDALSKRASARYADTTGDPQTKERAKELVQHYSAVEVGPSPPLSLASRVQTRAWRILICGWLWMLLARLSLKEWVFFTIVLPSWWTHSDDLDKIEAKQLMQRLRAALYRAGAGKASGWLFAMLDTEFDGSTNGFGHHAHGIATKGMIKVLRRLRKQRQFHGNSTDASRFPQVQIARKLRIDRPRGHLPNVITYAAKSMWRQHNSRLCADGKRRRVGKKHRIVELHRVRHLLWLHDNPVKDQVLLIHLAVVKSKLVRSKRGMGPAPSRR